MSRQSVALLENAFKLGAAGAGGGGGSRNKTTKLDLMEYALKKRKQELEERKQGIAEQGVDNTPFAQEVLKQRVGVEPPRTELQQQEQINQAVEGFGDKAFDVRAALNPIRTDTAESLSPNLLSFAKDFAPPESLLEKDKGIGLNNPFAAATTLRTLRGLGGRLPMNPDTGKEFTDKEALSAIQSGNKDATGLLKTNISALGSAAGRRDQADRFDESQATQLKRFVSTEEQKILNNVSSSLKEVTREKLKMAVGVSASLADLESNPTNEAINRATQGLASTLNKGRPTEPDYEKAVAELGWPVILKKWADTKFTDNTILKKAGIPLVDAISAYGKAYVNHVRNDKKVGLRSAKSQIRRLYMRNGVDPRAMPSDQEIVDSIVRFSIPDISSQQKRTKAVINEVGTDSSSPGLDPNTGAGKLIDLIQRAWGN